MYVIHMMPVHPPPTDFDPADTICMLPGMATFMEWPSGVRFFPEAMSELTISASPVVNPDQPPE